MNTSLIIGLTGQTGAGKSSVCAALEKTGAAVINADAVAREVMKAKSPCLVSLAEAFGEDVLDKDGSLKRAVLAKKAFSDRASTDLLNSITHPFIIKKTEEYIDFFRNKHYNMIIFDAPQLFESGGGKLCDIIAVVTAPWEVRKMRIMKRDGIDEKAALLRMNAQHDMSYYTEKADIVLDGSEPPAESADKLSEYVRKFLSEKNQAADRRLNFS